MDVLERQVQLLDILKVVMQFSLIILLQQQLVDSQVKCLDALFVKRLLDKYTEQFLPDVPELDYTKIDVRTEIKSKDFTLQNLPMAFFVAACGENFFCQRSITKPSAAWSIDTILRATLVSGDPRNIKDGLLTRKKVLLILM